MGHNLELDSQKKTILVVDDDSAVLRFVSGLLKDGGYAVLASNNGSEALAQSDSFKAEIHLLLTDFSMPEMSGIELATAITAKRPEIKVLLMSGFVGGMLVLNEGWHFLPKPFIPSQLRTLVAGLVSPATKSRFQGSDERVPAKES